MAYSASSPPSLVAQRIGGGGQFWYYASTDANTDVDAAGYFTNGVDLGMAVGGQVTVVDTDASPPTIGFAGINVVGASTTDITNATAATDSD
jgi:hypothetical protein